MKLICFTQKAPFSQLKVSKILYQIYPPKEVTTNKQNKNTKSSSHFLNVANQQESNSRGVIQTHKATFSRNQTSLHNTNDSQEMMDLERKAMNSRRAMRRGRGGKIRKWIILYFQTSLETNEMQGETIFENVSLILQRLTSPFIKNPWWHHRTYYWTHLIDENNENQKRS